MSVSSKRILVVSHKGDRIGTVPFIANDIAHYWQQSGYEVLFHQGFEGLPDADKVLLHANMTHVDERYLDALAGYPCVLNRAAVDISKRFISRQLVEADEGYSGAVLVKSNLNSHGESEWRNHCDRMRAEGGVGVGLRLMLEREQRKFQARRLRRAASPQSSEGYWVYPRVDDVPKFVWCDPYYVVEQFLPEPCEHGYALRHWFFLGRQDFCSVAYSDRPVFKPNDLTHSEPAPVPDQLREIRRELGFDYGKFDFTLHEGRVVLFDANKTPAFTSASRRVRFQPQLAELARGIEDYPD
ncbi:hypothetical protein [Solemya pervernicosa gill symbiont]|uniref:hypothetical protein n=1 Tax=Solemya pervernicosa gill symbiont TaxID=642797 RepID=UPI001084501E|nr:hypothetical protein [Solemya pervernicosa gill symbiont]